MGCKAIMASHRTPGPIDNPLNFERGTAAPVRDPKVARFSVRLCVPSVEDDCLRTGTNSTHQSPRNTDPADAATEQFRTRSQRLVALVLAPRLTLGILSCPTSTLACLAWERKSPNLTVNIPRFFHLINHNINSKFFHNLYFEILLHKLCVYSIFLL